MEGENVEIVAHKTKKAFILNRYFSYVITWRVCLLFKFERLYLK